MVANTVFKICIGLLAVGLYAETLDHFEQEAWNIVSQLSDDEIIAQTLMVGWSGIDASDDLLKWLTTYSIGGIKVFGWNGNNVARLRESIKSMQGIAQERLSGLPLLVATDQEGGLVRHIKDSTTITPGNLALGAANMAHDAYLTGYYINKELAAIGITMNFAPTVDVLVEKENKVIGTRAFSSDHRTTALLGTAYMQGSLAAGVLPTAKHFPGHGNTSVDSHGKLPVIWDTYETLWQRDFYPYRMMIPSGLPAILIGHLNFPNITAPDKPSTFSPIIIQDILRKRLGFTGLIITDDLYMGASYVYAIQNDWSVGELVLDAIRTGNDMILLSQTPTVNGTIMQTLQKAYRSSEALQERFQDAAHHVITAKLLQQSLRPIEEHQLPPAYTNVDSKSFFFQNALRSVTLIRKRDTPKVIENAGTTLVVGNDFDFIRAARSKLPKARILSYRSDETLSTIKQRIDAFADSETSIVFLVINDASYDLLDQLQPYSENLYVVSALNPFRLLEIPWIEHALAVYGWGFESYLGGFAALTGEIIAHGKLPFE